MTAVVEPPVARLAALPGVSTASRVAAQAGQARATGRVLPVVPALAGLLPDAGLRRGTTVAVHGASSLLLALLAEATAMRLMGGGGRPALAGPRGGGRVRRGPGPGGAGPAAGPGAAAWWSRRC